MMKRYLGLWLSICISLPCSATPADTIAPKPEKTSLLWKITGNDLRKPSYLFGTIHMLCAQDYFWTATMRKSMLQCEQVCFEMDMDDPKVMMDVGAGMIDNSGKQLKDYFTPDQYTKLSSYIADSLHMPMALLQQLKPAALLSLFLVKSSHCASTVSYESKIMDEATRKGKEVIGLEEPQEQVALLNSIPADTIVAEVLKAIDGQDDGKNAYTSIVAAYKQQDLAKLHTLILDASVGDNSIYAFLDERNIKWVDRMADMMEQKPVFFAVGVGHLWNENGLVSLLRKNGYKVEAVR
jgi:uncharacterized protein YbaP (TraB family)